jgi:peptidoglycan/xylan/chitin deacetylase (PgdA/CDA1 family)
VQVRHRAGSVVRLTFDNLGEVADLERGKWPADAPLGRHASVTRTLPRILDLLREHDVRATFFVEGLNAELYPDALRSIAEAGHEVAYHGWQHERWSELSPEDERVSLERGVAALDALGLRPLGFRPPGGRLTSASPRLLRELGFEYVSPQEGETAGGLEVRPFHWPLVDALYYLPHFADLRERYLGTRREQPPERLRAAIAAAGDEIVVFHPFLLGEDDQFDVLRTSIESEAADRQTPP